MLTELWRMGPMMSPPIPRFEGVTVFALLKNELP